MKVFLGLLLVYEEFLKKRFLKKEAYLGFPRIVTAATVNAPPKL